MEKEKHEYLAGKKNFSYLCTVKEMMIVNY